jgi:hypothetical protein
MSFNNIYNSIDTKSWSYQKNCLTGPIQSSAIGAILFSALDAFQGVPIQQVIKPQKLGTLYVKRKLKQYQIRSDQRKVGLVSMSSSSFGVWA